MKGDNLSLKVCVPVCCVMCMHVCMLDVNSLIPRLPDLFKRMHELGMRLFDIVCVCV